jgi:diguanylate cyclase (GGDEF)-like protein
VKSFSKPESGPRVVRGTRRPDLAARVRGRSRTLRAHLDSRDALADAIRQANATLDPAKVAGWLVGEAAGWFAATCWGVTGHDFDGNFSVQAEVGLTPILRPGIWSIADWVQRNGVEFSSADLSADPRTELRATGCGLGFPLICRGRTIGALVALDATPSTATPALGPSLLMAIRGLLEPAAIALDNAVVLQRVEAQSVTDDLTQLSNSRYLYAALRRETKRAARNGRPLSLLFLDLDGFKQVNDSHGHLAGSKALVEAAAVIRGCARETDVVARFGGDEFSLILPDTAQDGAVSVASRIRERLSAARFLTSDGLSVHLTASIGVATLPDVANSAEELLRAADMAMYKVKASGKDGIYIATAS